jgi:uncharacterized DUF497 family protein
MPKRDRTLAERGLDFADAGLVFGGVTATIRDVRHGYGEDRYITIGQLRGVTAHPQFDNCSPLWASGLCLIRRARARTGTSK